MLFSVDFVSLHVVSVHVVSVDIVSVDVVIVEAVFVSANLGHRKASMDAGGTCPDCRAFHTLIWPICNAG